MKTDKLKKLSACSDAREWVATQRNYKEAWRNCERGDWMLWLAQRLKVDDRKLTLAKFKCANQVRHLMKDERSIAALDAAERYGNGEINREELNVAAGYAANAAAAHAAAAAAAGYATTATYATYAAAAAHAATYAGYAAAAAAGYATTATYATYAAAAAHAATYAGYAATATYAAAAAHAATYAAVRKESLKKSADTCREILTDEVLTAYIKLKP